MDNGFEWGGVLVAVAMMTAMFVVPFASLWWDERKKRRSGRDELGEAVSGVVDDPDGQAEPATASAGRRRERRWGASGPVV